MKFKPKYRKRYRNELARELTERSDRAIQAMMRRKGMDLVQVIKYYLNENNTKNTPKSIR